MNGGNVSEGMSVISANEPDNKQADGDYRTRANAHVNPRNVY